MMQFRWRDQLFNRPLPKKWVPSIGERVAIKPGVPRLGNWATGVIRAIAGRFLKVEVENGLYPGGDRKIYRQDVEWDEVRPLPPRHAAKFNAAHRPLPTADFSTKEGTDARPARQE